jgi:hypothetical protein
VGTRLFAVPLLFCFALMVSAEAGSCATKEKKFKKRHISEDVLPDVAEDQPYPAEARGISKYSRSGVKYDLTCDDISPEIGQEYVIQHDQIGHSWYDFQKNGSMGRMISVTDDGYRHFSWMFTDGPYGYGYPETFRYVDANCKDPLNDYVGQVHVYGGAAKNAGYNNQAHLHDGRSVVVYHRSAGQMGDPVAASMLSMEDSLCTGEFNSFWDLPDSIPNAPSGGLGMWPKAAMWYDAAEEKDYIHVVMTEGSLSGFLVMLGYERCYLGSGDSLICQACVAGTTATYRLAKNTNYSDPANIIGYFDSSASITPVPMVSPVSARVAVAFLKPACDGSGDYLQDVCFIESMNNGDDWVDGSNYPPPEYNVTNYGCGYPEDERGYCDLSACYDYNDSLHIVWSTVGFVEPSYIQPGVSKLRHWSKEHGSRLITSAIWAGTDAGARNANIAKMSISAQDPVFHPGGDSVFLYTIWTQFDSTSPPDQSDAQYTNGEIYGCASFDGGATWGPSFNLTNTNTPGCAPGACLSEHWSSLAQNMYDGDLHIQYICDRHPGTALPDQDPGSVWQDNPVMYLHLSDWEGTGCPGPPYWILIEPPSDWHRPPLKITPGNTRNLVLEIGNPEGCPEVAYNVSSDHSCIQISAGGILLPGQTLEVTGFVDGSGQCEGTFIQGNVNLTLGYCLFQIPVHAVAADDYYECPVDSQTYHTLENNYLRMWLSANSAEWIHDIGTRPDTTFEVFVRGGPIVAVTQDGQTLVGRFMGDNDWRAGVRDRLYLEECDDHWAYNDFWTVYTKDIYIEATHLTPPYHCWWWWWEIEQHVKFFKPEAPDALQHTVIKYFKVKRHDPPGWWPEADPPQGPFTDYEDTYIGMAMDIDCPWDTMGWESARNYGGYDAVNHIAWQRGWDYTGAHAEYNDYHAGIALADAGSAGESTVPYGSHCVKNNTYLYPQSPWGWDDEQLYDLASTPGNAIHDPDSLVDRSYVLTARKIDAGTNPDAEAVFTVIEVVAPEGLEQLQDLVDSARARVEEDPWTGAGVFPMICGDANGNRIVDLGDAVAILGIFKCGYCRLVCPRNRSDCNNDGVIDVGDAVVLLNYLFRRTGRPICPGMW